jgi:hypothetical protein
MNQKQTTEEKEAKEAKEQREKDQAAAIKRAEEQQKVGRGETTEAEK